VPDDIVVIDTDVLSFNTLSIAFRLFLSQPLRSSDSGPCSARGELFKGPAWTISCNALPYWIRTPGYASNGQEFATMAS
jgi:hypothetical protein